MVIKAAITVSKMYFNHEAGITEASPVQQARELGQFQMLMIVVIRSCRPAVAAINLGVSLRFTRTRLDQY